MADTEKNATAVQGFVAGPVLPPAPNAMDNNHAPTDNATTASKQETESSASTCANADNSVSEPELAAPAQDMSATNIAILMTSLCLSVTLSSLDLTIVTPAVPSIVADFNSQNGYVWIGSAYILAYTAVTTIWASISNIWGRKPIILIAVAIFLVGSLVCALAPTMTALLVGRVIQGLGASGMSVLVNVIIADVFSLRDRGLYLAITSLVWAVGSAIGPVIGGTFTTKVSWRWCFWINLPIGGVVIPVFFFFLNLPSPNTSIRKGLKAIDWIGTILVVGGILMVLLGLDFGGGTFAWNSASVICLIVFGWVVIGVFVFNEWKWAKDPIIPLRLFSTVTRAAAYGVFSVNSYVFIGLAYYLPLYSQSVLGANALVSGLELLPLIVACSLAAAFGGIFIQKTGIYRPIMYIAQVFLTLGTGLFIDLEFEQNLTKLIIFQIITGIGVGLNIEGPILAAQAASPVRDTAAVTATMGFMRSIATAISVVVGGVIFQNEMSRHNAYLSDQIGLENASLFNADTAEANVNRISSLPGDQQIFVRQAYYEALRTVWIMYVAFAGLATVLNLFVGNFHLSKERQGPVLGSDREKKDDLTQRKSSD